MKVLAGGVFNIIHPGHILFLKKAKSLGDSLVVVVAHDKTVLKRKGYLLKKSKERKKSLEKLGFIDRVVVGDERDFLKVVEREKPDIIVLGYDQSMNENELKSLKGTDCRIVRIREKLKGFKTREMLKK